MSASSHHNRSSSHIHIRNSLISQINTPLHNTIMSVRTLQHSNRCTLMTPELNTKNETSRDIRATRLSKPTRGEEDTAIRGRRRDAKKLNDDESDQKPAFHHSLATKPLTVPAKASAADAAFSLPPRLTLPSSLRRRSASPVNRCQRAATPHPKKAQALAQAASPMRSTQPMHTRSCYGEPGYKGCKWRYEDYKHQMHLNWLERI